MAVPQKPNLLLYVEIRRRAFFRRFLWSLLGTVAAIGALAAFDAAGAQGLIGADMLTIGTIAGLLAIAFFGWRTLLSLWRWLRRRDETIRVFDKGFVWTRQGATHQYGWSKLIAYREGGRGLYLGKLPLFQWGAHRLRMDDGQVFNLTGAYGDLRRFAAVIRRPAARATGVYMGQKLRREEPIKLSRTLTLWPGGIEVGRHEIPWSDVEIKLKNRRIVVYRRSAKGAFKPVRSYDTRGIDNAGGLLEIAAATIRNHQRERFEKKREVS